jgi:hypothetical protein
MFSLCSIGSHKGGQRSSRAATRIGKYVFLVFGNLKMYAHCDLDYLMKRQELCFDSLFCVETRRKGYPLFFERIHINFSCLCFRNVGISSSLCCVLLDYTS